MTAFEVRTELAGDRLFLRVRADCGEVLIDEQGHWDWSRRTSAAPTHGFEAVVRALADYFRADHEASGCSAELVRSELARVATDVAQRGRA